MAAGNLDAFVLVRAQQLAHFRFARARSGDGRHG
jgi:hypothetical protein